MKRICVNCGDSFEGRADARYCSSSCRVQAHRAGGKATSNTEAHILGESRMRRAERGEIDSSEAVEVARQKIEGPKKRREWLEGVRKQRVLSIEDALALRKDEIPGIEEQVRLRTAPVLYAEADRLVALQKEHRGFTKVKLPDKSEGLKMGPYVATEETEKRAKRILRLRRRGALIEYPL